MVKGECIQCGNKLKKNNNKYCSKKCRFIYEKDNKLGFYNKNFQSRMGKKGGINVHLKYPKINLYSLQNCEYCGKLTKKKRFCSHKCEGHVIGISGGKAAQKTLKKEKKGLYGMTKEQHQKNVKKSLITQKKKGIGFYGITTEQHRESVKKSNETNKKNSLSHFKIISL